jgi:hypothetical protein
MEGTTATENAPVAPPAPSAGGTTQTPANIDLFSSVFSKKGIMSKACWHRDKEENKDKCSLPDTLKIVTFNVFFGDLVQDDRAKALIESCVAYDPDVIALQEVTMAYVKTIKEIDVVKKNYRMAPEAGYAA